MAKYIDFKKVESSSESYIDLSGFREATSEKQNRLHVSNLHKWNQASKAEP